MKKINTKAIKNELEILGVNSAKADIILNNIDLYNDLVAAYKRDKEQHNIYLMYQLNGMIVKQLNDLKKLSDSKNKDAEGDDKLTSLLTSIKQQKLERRD